MCVSVFVCPSQWRSDPAWWDSLRDAGSGLTGKGA